MNIKKIINEELNYLIETSYNGVTRDDYKQAYMFRINKERDGLLLNVVNNSNFEFVLGIEMEYVAYGKQNKCETNTYTFIKEKLQDGDNNFLPVVGYHFTPKSLYPVEHWWVYDSNRKQHIEVTPMVDEKPWAYAGIIEFNLNNDIVNSNTVWDIEFFKGGYGYYKYFKI